MTELSLAAQAIWDAAWQLSPVNCGSHEDRRRQQIAAALRAAADSCDPAWLAVTALHHLYAIADELENSND